MRPSSVSVSPTTNRSSSTGLSQAMTAAGDRLRARAADPQGLDRLEQSRLGIHHGVDPQRAVRSGGLPAIDDRPGTVVPRILHRLSGQKLLGFVFQRQAQEGQEVHAARFAGEQGRRPRGGAIGRFVDQPGASPRAI